MRKLLNTLYITTPDAYMSKDGLNLVISVKQSEVFRIPVSNIESVVSFSYMGTSPGAMKLCADSGVSLNFLSPSGNFIGRFQGPTHGNVLLRTEQYRISDDPERANHLGRLIIAGKIHNSRSVLNRYIRDYGQNPVVESAINALTNSKRKALQSTDSATLRGIEGDAAATYFGCFPHLIVQQSDQFPFHGRNRHPPKDATNTLLSFVYALLAHDVQSALESVGLDPYVGFIHALRPGRASLALDMMEEFRAYLADRLVLSLINRRQVTPQDFIAHGEDAVRMKDDCRKLVLQAWQKRKQQTIEHPYLKEKIPIGLLPYVQAMLMARYIRSDIENYPVFLTT